MAGSPKGGTDVGMVEPTNPLPWRIGKLQILTGQGYEEWEAVLDAKGDAVLVLSNNQEYIVTAANAYPRLRAQLAKALEACRALVAFLDWCTALSRGDYEAADKIMPRSEVNEGNWHPLLRQADQAAREALEMAEGRDGDVRP